VMTDRGIHGEPTAHRCEVCGDPLDRDDVIAHVRRFHADRWDDATDRPTEVGAA